MNNPKDTPSIVGVAMRDLARLRSVAFIVARHGFGPLLMKTPLGKRLFDKPPEGDAALRETSAPVRFAKLLAALGPTYIKFGQILSMRKDIFAPEWIEALEKLQDDAPRLPFTAIREQVETSLGGTLEDLYGSFEQEPLATASIAQTHRARTKDGDEVVVKVQRPGIEATMRSDLDLLYLCAQVLEASIDEMQLVGVVSVVEEFEKGLLRELNFNQELSNLLEFQRNLDPERKVTVPRPYPELSTRTVLTMQFFKGKADPQAHAEEPGGAGGRERDRARFHEAGLRGRRIPRRPARRQPALRRGRHRLHDRPRHGRAGIAGAARRHCHGDRSPPSRTTPRRLRGCCSRWARRRSG